MKILSDKIHTLNELKEAAARKILSLENIISPIGEPVVIHRIEIPCENCDLLSWLHLQDFDTKIYWANRQGEFEMAGVGVTDSLKSQKAQDYELIFEDIHERFDFLNPNVKFYGGLCFDFQNLSDGWKALGTYQFIVPRFEFIKTKTGTTFAVNISYKDVNEEALKKILTELEQLNLDLTLTGRPLVKPRIRKDFPDKREWGDIFNKALKSFDNKECQKIVLARKSVFTFEEEVPAFLLKRKLKSFTPECFHFCFQPQPGFVFLGASPERLYKRVGTHLESEAIAGTQAKPHSAQLTTHDEDNLLNSPKDLKEHQYVVDAIESALNPHVLSFKADKKPSLLELNWGHHLKTNIEGELKEGVTDAELLQSLHPTPAVAGYPVDKALKLINNLEQFSRGWYAGLFGYIGQDVTEFTVAIRSGLIEGKNISLFAGAGILPESNCEGEWDEIEQKMNSFLKVFGE